MDRVLSARVDPAVIHRLNATARRLNLSKKAVLERAILSYAERVEAEEDTDVLELTAGAWQRDEAPADTVAALPLAAERGHGAPRRMRAYVDADVVIWQLRGEPLATAFLRRLRDAAEYELWIGAMQRAEVVFHLRAGEATATGLLLSLCQTAPVDEGIVDLAGALYRRFHASHGVDPNGALLAATAMTTGGKIYTLNVKHYPMPDLLVERAF